MNKPMKPSPFQPLVHYSSLDLITIRTECHAGIYRLERALEIAIEENSLKDDSVRKNTTDLINTLQHAMIALHTLESERNIATHNASLEKTAHARTIGQLDEANNIIRNLKIEGETMRRNIEKLMSK